MDKLWSSAMQVLAAGRDRRSADTARLAQERAFAAWAFDEDHQVWIPGVLRR